MNPRVFAFTLVLVALALGLAVAVRFSNLRQTAALPLDVPPVVSPTSTPNVPAKPKPIEFRSADKVTTVVVDSEDMYGASFLVGNPFQIHGTSTAFESTLSWKLMDAGGETVGQGYTMIASPDVGIPGPYEITGFIDTPPKTQSGVLMVYEASAKDGSPIHVVTIPVEFSFTAAKGCAYPVMVAFGNTKKDPAMLDCSKTTEVTRTVCADASSAVAVAVHELLKGPTAQEKTSGSVTGLPEGVRDPSIRMNGSDVALDFDQSLEIGVAGSCRVTAIRAQIEDTVSANRKMQGGNVTISILGRTEDILQP